MDGASDLELQDRYQTIFAQYIELATSLSKMLEAYGRTRNELQLLVVELQKRHLDTNIPEEKKDIDASSV